jgi:hypothetical protein
LVASSLSLLADLAPHQRDGAPRPAAAAEPGLVAALAPDARALPSHDAATTGAAAAAASVLEATLEGADGARRAAEFVRAGGGGHLVRARQLWVAGVLGRAPGPCEDVDTAGEHAPKPLRLCSPGAHKHS